MAVAKLASFGKMSSKDISAKDSMWEFFQRDPTL
jgi:hypothetical protein